MIVEIKTQHLEGRPHYIVPTVMIVEGVLNGSNGPIFYPRNELAATARYWNGKPVVVYHPAMYSGSWAGEPAVFDRQRVGTIFNARMSGNRLLADAWIDTERIALVDRRVNESIRSRQMVEVSTGLVITHDGPKGVWNGKEYQSTAAGIIPDHLAILPDKVGACSIADGAGLIRNAAHFEEVLMMPSMSF